MNEVITQSQLHYTTATTPANKTNIMDACDGETNFTRSFIAGKLNLKRPDVASHIDQLCKSGYLKITASSISQFNITKKGHQALHSRLNFDDKTPRKNLLHFYTHCCPGRGPTVA